MKRYFIEELVASCNEKLKEINPVYSVSKRTVQGDIRHMESAEGWSIELHRHFEGKKIYYRYVDTNFSIDKQPLNQAELEQLKAAMELLGRFKGMPQFAWVNELMPKMEQSFIMEKGLNPIISFDNNAYLTGIEYLGPLFHHILYKRPLCITYQSFKRDHPSKFIIHPYYLKQYNNRWFLFGRNQDHLTITNLPLDRIQEIKEESITFLENSTDFDEYFEDIIGVTVSDGSILKKIILEFNNKSGPYILSKPLHGSQKILKRATTGVRISIEVIPNYELESLILSFGENVSIIEPVDFKQKCIERISKNLSNYNPL